MTVSSDEVVAELNATIRALRQQLAAANGVRDLASAREAALAEVLGIINGSPGSIQPVFDFIAQQAARLCDVPAVGLALFDGTMLHLTAQDGFGAAFAQGYSAQFPPAAPDTVMGRAIVSKSVVQIEDIHADSDYRITRPQGPWSAVAVPLLRNGTPVGVISLGRPVTGRYPDSQVTLLQSFAAQAVIAMENARLLALCRGSYVRLRLSLYFCVQLDPFRYMPARSTGG